MGKIEDFFSIIKKDILNLDQEINSLKLELSFLNKNLAEIKNIINNLQKQNINFNTKLEKVPTQEVVIKTDEIFNPTNNWLFRSLKDQNLRISTGNKGVPTDRQTDTTTHKKGIFNDISGLKSADKILESLDNLKKEIRLKFKRLTSQEMAVFSAIYLIEQRLGYVSYKVIADQLNLTESSIRDYVRRLIFKGIPVDKEKPNNKEIILRISPSLRKITTLETIQRLREL